MFIEELTGSVKLEDSQTEYKGKLNRDDVVGWLKSIAGFANATGGAVGTVDGKFEVVEICVADIL